VSDEQYQLVEKGGSEDGRCFQLGVETVIIGRDEYSDIVFDHRELSRHHARLTTMAGAYVLQDLGSTNGTFIDGKRLDDDPVILRPGQTIRLGGAVSLSFERVPQEEPAPETVPATLVAATVVAMPGTLPESHDTVQFKPGEVQGNPFVGPRAFEPDERRFFYGRDDEIAILAGQVMSRRVSLFFRPIRRREKAPARTSCRNLLLAKQARI